VISVNEVPAGFARWPQVEVRFRLTSSSEFESRDSEGKKTKVFVVYDASGNPIDFEMTETDQSDDDIYEKLKKLGDLRDSNVLSEEEFQREKERLLTRGKF